MRPKARKSCPNCRRLQAKLDAQEVRLKVLESTVAQLQEQLAAARKDSSTSSKPPSSDIVKPAKPDQTIRPLRRRTARPSQSTTAPPFPARSGQPRRFEHDPRLTCPCCGVTPASQRRPGPRRPAGRCRPAPLACRTAHQPRVLVCPLPAAPARRPCPRPSRRAACSGPRLTALVAYLKGVCHASYSTVRKFLRDIVGLTISRGQLAKVIAKVSVSPRAAPTRICSRFCPSRTSSTSMRPATRTAACRCGRGAFGPSFSHLFKIEPTRSADVLIEVLGEEFDGVLGCDCFSGLPALHA